MKDAPGQECEGMDRVSELDFAEGNKVKGRPSALDLNGPERIDDED